MLGDLLEAAVIIQGRDDDGLMWGHGSGDAVAGKVMVA